MFKLVFLSIIIWTQFPVFGQKITGIHLEGQFKKDTVSIGEIIPYTLVVQYPRNADVILPDSTYRFTPFEYESKQFYPTRSDSLISTDSLILFLSTFEVDSIQHLSLPVYLVQNGDSTRLNTPLDSVFLHQMVTSLPDSVAMMVNTSYVKVPLKFNYPYLMLGVAIFLIISVTLGIIYGKKIRKWYRLYRLKQRHHRFLKLFSQKASTNPDIEYMLAIWKRYMQGLLERPFENLTTREIVAQEEDKNLITTLQTADQAIYGHDMEVNTQKIFASLKQFTIYTYEDQIRKIRYE